jgi:hypothetical protein
MKFSLLLASKLDKGNKKRRASQCIFQQSEMSFSCITIDVFMARALKSR